MQQKEEKIAEHTAKHIVGHTAEHTAVTVLPELLFLVAPITFPPVTAVPPPVTVVAEPLPLLLLEVSVEPLLLELFPLSGVGCGFSPPRLWKLIPFPVAYTCACVPE